MISKSGYIVKSDSCGERVYLRISKSFGTSYRFGLVKVAAEATVVKNPNHASAFATRAGCFISRLFEYIPLPDADARAEP